ncbi:UDP-N-acetylmuramoylalanine--D-glutamate ligase [Apilactobacillus kunkeei]|uniref:UDP-N-acetylmuramoyl-L-alanine--D-glutamate ligase n=1 Tax=Apilactobacillus kunkeei TaxID=148814 RepID=UPI0006BF7DF7|nr:UDP-N-acetylmuramoyl-L-alanine--D-glutamate ligase [Apilactobacillus kunkeei]KOY74606.1 UDP-N-acetylmuramoylalanine--D-glutamate ligase [Apilactobacillus kunkeei]
MKNIDDYQNKNILVLGAGMSGINASKLLKQLNANVWLNDANPLKSDAKEELEKIGVEVIDAKQSPKILDDYNFDLIVKNPGIFYDNELIKEAIKRNIPITVEVEIASQVSEAPIVGVTGSNGKTTVSTMINDILNEERTNGHSYVAGNIGVPASTVTTKATKDDDIVLELSSFMLVGIKTLHPHIAVLNNVFSNHLDYHKTRENYVNAKMSITENQDENDYFVVNFDNEEWRELSKRSKAKVVPFSYDAVSTDGAYVKDEQIFFKDEFVMNVDEIRVPGQQNVQNALAAIAVAKIMGKSNSALKKALSTFGGVRHRVQYVLTADGRKFYNDSKATDIEATQVALRSFKDNVVLIAGGLDRGYTFEKLEKDFADHVKAITLFGETKDLLADTAKKAGVKNIKIVNNMKEAVDEVWAMSEEGDIVLLSPANASWDQYDTFEQRGDEFIQLVEQKTGRKEEN